MANKTLYNYEEEKQGKRKKRKREAKHSEIKNKEKKRKNRKNAAVKPSNQIDSDNEIIIGVTVNNPTKIEKTKTKEKKKVKEKNKVRKNDKLRKINENTKIKAVKDKIKVDTTVYQEKNEVEKDIKKVKRRNKIIRRTSIITLLLGTATFAMISPIFNINSIKVSGNNKLNDEKVSGLSGVEIGQNIFRINKDDIKKKLKQNAYIEDVKINRNLPNELEILVQERIASFLIEFGNSFVVLNNQGYIIEISDEKKSIPMVVGLTTPEENYKENNRLNEQDLNNFNTVLKIMNAANSNGIECLISKIDISDINEVKIYLESEQKTVYLGDCSNLVHRIQWVKAILENKKEIPGEIMVNMNLNIKSPYFRENIQ